ncbi:MAG: hypothetical protein FJ280_22515 [Planctomycetes bacterium]|nr:hypothetical protein [Planctomycetota bacterium]
MAAALLVLVLAGPRTGARDAASFPPGVLAQTQSGAGQTTITPQQAQQIQEALKARDLQTPGGAPVPPAQGQTPPPKPGSVAEQAQTKEQPAEPKPAPSAPPTPTAEPELSTVERLLSGQLSPNVSMSLRQFGYEVFTRPVSTFAPVTDVPVGPDYVIGPGDAFTLTMWGRVDAQYTLLVNRDGQVILPEVGALKVWGMKYGDLAGFLQQEISRKHTDFKMSITMSRLRTIQVFVVGEAATPGTYTVSSLSTVINALMAAGGPSKNGSLRKIRLIRTGRAPVEIDLYDFLLGGDRTQDLRLQDGDTIFAP